MKKTRIEGRETAAAVPVTAATLAGLYAAATLTGDAPQGRSSPVGDAVEPLDDDDKQGKEISGTLCEGEGRGNGDGDDGVLGGLDGLLGLLVDGDEHSR
ncbi:unnamed protein product [Cuscuta campestris]|uniref:Uncharacterized protein n=2 Tax=Cuscuta sect. Cleistogrammica TaxID=1824901 RepID=A0A484N378_9ASTE|nr:hypothetical protein DM860_001045 [Cuscuta australis]VFQ95751.1 unnamed protein product [Cuscuta campestris]